MSNTIYWDKLRILVTNSCNYRCPFCHNEGQVSRKTIKTMDFDKFKILIDAVKDEGISEICFSGGEPFLDKNLIEMIRYAYRNALRQAYQRQKNYSAITLFVHLKMDSKKLYTGI